MTLERKTLILNGLLSCNVSPGVLIHRVFVQLSVSHVSAGVMIRLECCEAWARVAQLTISGPAGQAASVMVARVTKSCTGNPFFRCPSVDGVGVLVVVAAVDAVLCGRTWGCKVGRRKLGFKVNVDIDVKIAIRPAASQAERARD